MSAYLREPFVNDKAVSTHKSKLSHRWKPGESGNDISFCFKKPLHGLQDILIMLNDNDMLRHGNKLKEMNGLGVKNGFSKIENYVLNLKNGIRVGFTFCYK
jgi:hypothetical protein